ncbi:MAG: co-chaperone YbbN, partial [Acidobacteria bacterium]|nr:co-chaperone YbbN [Acidobacteriota bacterium]
MTTHAIDVDASNFEQVVIEGSRRVPIVIDFWAPWCGPCRALAPILEKLAAEHAGRFVLAKINSDENPELAARFGVRGIPAVKAVVDGAIVGEFV